MRRTFTFASVSIAALSVAWAAMPVSAGILPAHAALAATTKHAVGHTGHAATARTLSAAITPGSSPTQLQSFPGMSEQAAIAAAGTGGNPNVTTPADPSIAVGPSNVVEAVNSAIEVSTRAGTPLMAMNISAMIKNTSWSVRYPRVLYDPASGRFILMVLQFNPVISACGSQVAVMVSQSNPASPWISRGTINIDSELGGGLELSNVAVGLTANLIVESSDYVSCSTGLAVNSQTVIFQRSDLVNGTLGVNSIHFLVPGPVGLEPAMGPTAQSIAYEVANNANCTSVQSGSIAVWAISVAPGANTVSHTCTAESESATSIPPAAAQGGTSATLTTGDDRFVSAVWQNNALWVAGNTGCTPSGDTHVRSCLNVVDIAASSGGIVTGATQLAAEGVNGSFLYFPALALDSAGDAILTFDESSSSSFESIMVAAITEGTWSSFLTLDASATFYNALPGCSLCLWGDYSAALQDPLHPTDVWVVGEDVDGATSTNCATANTCWNTFVGRYTFAGPSISSLTPAAGPASGGSLVSVAGSDFVVSSTTLNFAGAPLAITPGSLTPDSFTFTTPSSTTSGLVQAQVTTPLGTSPSTVGSGYLYVGLANYVPLTPFRILDTRPGSCIQCHADPTLGALATEKLQLTGVTGLPSGTDPIPSTATAVVLNVTEVAGTANSLLTVYPFGTSKPNASNLNFPPGKVIANLTTVTLGQGGAIDIFNAAGTVNVIADVEGYFQPAPSSTVTGEFHPIAPVRVCDTRSTSPTPACKSHGALGTETAMVVNVTGTGSDAIPGTGTAAAVVVNLTGVAGSASTYLSLFPTNSSGQCTYTGSHAPPFSTLNLAAGVVEANRVMVALGPATTGGPPTSLCVYNAAGTINVLLDAGGWFGSGTAAAGSQYQGIQPTRICDTRSGSGLPCAGATLTAGKVDLVVVAGKAGIPSIGSGTLAVAVIANLTAIAPTTATYLSIYPANLTVHPNASDINVSPGQVLPNLTVVQLDPNAGAGQGDVNLFNAAGTINAVVDIEGWFQ